MNLAHPRRLALLVLLVLAEVAGATVALPALDSFLVVDDGLVRGDVIFVLDGQTPARELEAAALWHRGLAPVVVVSRAWDSFEETRRMAGEPTRQERAARVLLHRGVPADAIVRLDRTVDNTLPRRQPAADVRRGRSSLGNLGEEW